jgi:hypothetical protein
MWSVVLGAIGCVAVAASLGAQEPPKRFTGVTSYVLSIPTGDTRDLITRPSWLGASLEGVWALGPRTSAGVAFSLQDFHDPSSGTRNFPWGAATSQQTRNLLITTAMATGRWYPLAGRTRRAHLGLGAGAVFAEERHVIGASQTLRSAAHVAVAPEAGWRFAVVSGVDGLVSARYTIPAKSGHYVSGARSYPFATLSLGIIER